MPEYLQRSYDPQRDLLPVIDLLIADRAAGHGDVALTPSRLHLLLASRLQDPRDARGWFDEKGLPVGFAMLLRRNRESSHVEMERLIIHPDARATDLEEIMLHWAEARGHELSFEREKPITLLMTTPHDEEAAIFLRHGFTQEVDEFNQLMRRPLDDALKQPVIPSGYTLKTLADDADIAAYEAISGFTPITTEHRRAQIASKDYYHAIIVAPNGTFAAYCESSVAPAEWKNADQAIGWIDYIRTLPSARNHGLGIVMLQAALHYLRERGATTAMLTTTSTNTIAQATFARAGFTPYAQSTVYRKTIAL